MKLAHALDGGAASCISIFAGRVADTGRDPVPVMTEALKIMRSNPNAELIWASPRELLNIYQADEIGCHIITVTNDILKKLALIGKDLRDYSLETVKMFYDDAVKSGYTLEPARVEAEREIRLDVPKTTRTAPGCRRSAIQNAIRCLAERAVQLPHVRSAS